MSGAAQLVAKYVEATERVVAALAIHKPDGAVCGVCLGRFDEYDDPTPVPYPCPTAQALGVPAPEPTQETAP